MTRGEIKTEILVRSGKDTTSAWTSEAFVNDWINQNHKWAAGYKPWPMTEGRTSTTWAATEEIKFEGYKADSFRIITVGGKRLQKINFDDYIAFKENEFSQSDRDSRVFSDKAGINYFNVSADVSGTMTAYGQYIPADIPDGDGSAGDDAETVFTGNGDEGNQAIIEKCLAYINYRDTNPSEAQLHDKNAKQILDDLWKRVQDEQFAYQTKDRSMFEYFNVIRGGHRGGIINEDQFGNL